MNKDETLINYLKDNTDRMNRSVGILKESYNKCSGIGMKENLSSEESEAFEAFTSRFARTVDIFTQKLLKIIPVILREEAFTFIDRINFAVKIGAIDSAGTLKILRDIRNEIAHDYASEDIKDIYRKVLKYSPVLFEEISSTLAYISNKLL